MADVRPFRALRYDPAVAGELGDIVCPPFDTISQDLQRSLYGHSPYNVVRLEAGERLPVDTLQNNRYTRSAALLAQWVAGEVLAREEERSFYLVRHSFHAGESPRTRLELMAAVGLEDYQSRLVLPHEYTRDADKRDRLALMEACRANFSPIMCLYQDADRRVWSVLSDTVAREPLLDFEDAAGQEYRMWRIADREAAGEITAALAGRPLYIADGHHRYETALAYRDTGPKGGDASGYVMMGLIEFDDPGLMVLPYHRVLGGLDGETLARVRRGLGGLFHGEPFGDPGLGDLEALQGEIDRRGATREALGLLDPSAGACQILGLREDAGLSAWGDIAESEAWVLEERVLRPILGDALGRHVDYIHDGVEARERVLSGEFQMGFFLKPFPLDLFRRIMDLGQRLPPKSTFFYPKLATGLVINPLEGNL